MASLISSSRRTTATLLLLLLLPLLLFLAGVPTSNAFMQWRLSLKSWLPSTPKSKCPHLTCCRERWSNVSRTKGLQFSPGDACDGTFVYTPEFKHQLTKACDCYDQYPEEMLNSFSSRSPVIKLLMRTHCKNPFSSSDEQARLRRQFCDAYKPQPPPMMSPDEIHTSFFPSPPFFSWVEAALMIVIAVFWVSFISFLVFEVWREKNEKRT